MEQSKNDLPNNALEVSLMDLFGFGSTDTFPIPAAEPQFGSQAIPGYVMRLDLVRDMHIFWDLGKRAAMLVGHKGSGKTSVVTQWHLKLRSNLKSMTGNGKTTLEALFGQYVVAPNGGGLVWQDGPVTWAARTGSSVLINEFNAIPEDVQLALMDVLQDGEPLTLPEGGEQFMPLPGFRVFCTMNPTDGHDFMYRGRKPIDAALKERFFWIDVGYSARSEEENALSNHWATMGEDPVNLAYVTKHMLDVAESVRAKSHLTSASSIPELISTRVLIGWATYWLKYSNMEGSIHKALQCALTNGCSPEVKFAIHKVVEDKTGQPSPFVLVGSTAMTVAGQTR